jgi:hypothetical protein
MRTPPFCVSRRFVLALFALLSFVAISPAVAQTSKSATIAKDLATALDASKLEAIAAADPADPSIFVAALYFQGSQLLVVSAKYAAPPLMVAKIKEKNYRDVYIDLSSASVAGSKVFIIDSGVDGLAPKPGDGGADSFEQGTTQVLFDGDWKKAKMSEEDYLKAFGQADERYSKLLTLLATQAKASKGTGF